MHFLLVHGTTQSPDGWRPLMEELTALGQTAATTDLARFGDGLSAIEYGEAVAAEHSGLPDVDVVVAHSGSGLLLPAIAVATRATLQVYLAAVVPHGAMSLLEEVDQGATDLFHAEWIGIDPTTDREAAQRFLFHDCDAEAFRWALSTLRRFVPVSVYAERVAPAPTIPAVSVVPLGDRTLRAD